MKSIVLPAIADFETRVRSGNISLHHVFSTNFFLAHAVDYVHAIRKADGINGGRRSLVSSFDQLSAVEGLHLNDVKFELIDAVNNSMKHIALDPAKYKTLEERYGPIAFHCLIEKQGKVLFMLDGYRFDYARVVILPVVKAIRMVDLDDIEDILSFARGEMAAPYSVETWAGEGDDPIEEMIQYCNPQCDACGEERDDCSCATCIFDGKTATFQSAFNVSFDFDGVMSRISGAYVP